MGYSIPNKWDFLEVNQQAQNQINIDSVATDISLSTITMPSYIGNLQQAFLDVYVQQVRDTSGAQNNISGAQYVQLRDSGLTYRNAILIPSGVLDVAANGRESGIFQFMGATDLSSYIAAGGVYLCRWNNAKSTGDDLQLLGTYLRMRLYFE